MSGAVRAALPCAMGWACASGDYTPSPMRRAHTRPGEPKSVLDAPATHRASTSHGDAGLVVERTTGRRLSFAMAPKMDKGEHMHTHTHAQLRKSGETAVR